MKHWLLIEAENIFRVINNLYLGKNGLLCEKIDSSTGKIVSDRAIVDELGDYVQNVAWLGMESNNSDYVNWALNQVELGVKYCQMPSGLFYTFLSVDATKAPLKTNFRPVYSIYNSDSIIGLVSLYQLTKHYKLKEIIDTFFSGVFKYFISKEGYVNYATIPSLNFSLPLSGPNICMNYAEELVNMYSFTGEKKYLEQAEALVSPWLSSQYFLKHGLFVKHLTVPGKSVANAAIESSGMSSLDTAVLAKTNTHSIFGCLSLYRATKKPELKEAIIKWRNSIAQKHMDEGHIFYSFWNAKTNKSWNKELWMNHSVIEALIDIYVDLEDSYSLQLAENCANSWIHQINRGLLPDRFEKGTLTASLDPHVDFSINLLKLYELTGKTIYRNTAMSLLENIVKHFKLEFGYAQTINIASGERNPILETKFLGLFIKGLLTAYSVIEKNQQIFKESNYLLRNLARDR